MKSIKVYHYDAFSKEPNKGNPAGVVVNSEELSDAQMQEIAFKVGFNETAFLVPSEAADLRIRFFTPGHEMNLCGHATVATMYALHTQGVLEDKTEFTVETKAGILPITIQSTVSGDVSITMKQAPPLFEVFEGSREDLAYSIGIDATDIHDTFPILYGSTGTWTLLLPVKNIEAFQRMKPNNKAFPAILKERPASSVHPFCTETYDPKADMHARHFSSPFSGTFEDPVTGTASGVLGAYFSTYIQTHIAAPLHLVVEQGQEIGKDGRVGIKVSKNQDSQEVEMTGHAVFVTDFDITVEKE